MSATLRSPGKIFCGDYSFRINALNLFGVTISDCLLQHSAGNSLEPVFRQKLAACFSIKFLRFRIGLAVHHNLHRNYN